MTVRMPSTHGHVSSVDQIRARHCRASEGETRWAVFIFPPFGPRPLRLFPPILPFFSSYVMWQNHAFLWGYLTLCFVITTHSAHGEKRAHTCKRLEDKCEQYCQTSARSQEMGDLCRLRQGLLQTSLFQRCFEALEGIHVMWTHGSHYLQ